MASSSEDLDSSVQTCEEARLLRSIEDPHVQSILQDLGNLLMIRSDKTKSIEDVDSAISCYEDSLKPSELADEIRGERQGGLMTCRLHRHTLTQADADLDLLADYCIRTTMDSWDESERFQEIIGAVGDELWKRGAGSSDLGHLTRAITFFERWIRFHPRLHRSYPIILYNLATSVNSRFELTSDANDASNALALGEELLRLWPEGHTDHADAIKVRALTFNSRYKWVGDRTDASQSISLKEKVLVLRPEGHPQHADAMQSLAISFGDRYGKEGDPADAAQAISLQEKVLVLRPEGHPQHADAMRCLAITLSRRYNQESNPVDASQAISLDERVLALRPEGHSEHADAMRNLAASFGDRYRQEGDPADAAQAVFLLEKVLVLRPEGHPEHADAIQSLAISFSDRYSQEGDPADAAQAISLLEKVLALRPEGHPEHADAIQSLAISFSERYRQEGNTTDVSQAISLQEKVLVLRPEGHPRHDDAFRRLASSLKSRFDRTQQLGDIELAISFQTKVLNLRPEGHAKHAEAKRDMAIMLMARHRLTANPDDLEISMKLYTSSVADTASPPSTSLLWSLGWVHLANENLHTSALDAYTATLRLLDRAVSQSISLEMRYVLMSKYPQIRVARGLAVDAAAVAVSKGCADLAVSLLEQGRSIIFHQFGRLRTQLDQLRTVSPELASSFASTSHQLEEHYVHRFLPDSFASQIDRSDHEYRRARRYQGLSVQWRNTVDDIRELPGFEDFLKPRTFPQLRKAADRGPVIIVNVSRFRSDAIIVVATLETPVVVPLPDVTREKVDELAESFGDRPAILHPTRALSILRDIWAIIVKPVVDVLRSDRVNLKYDSRIWWCPTGQAARLPLHAAGPYAAGERDLVHYFTSSYIPNLTTLIEARKLRKAAATTAGRMSSLLLVGQGNTPDQPELPSALTEVEAVRRLVPEGIKSLVLKEKSGTKDAVSKGMTNCDWVHLICHGHRNDEEPFSSHFSLWNGGLYLLDIIANDLPQAEFAFLSACHSAGMHETLPDEYLHPAAGMLIAGFKGVVGTMWALDDSIGPQVPENFYKELFKKPKKERVGKKQVGPSALDAAAALTRTIRALPENFPLMQRINLVHYGI